MAMVIDLSSSPEPSTPVDKRTRSARCQGRPSRKPRTTVVTEVIELSDSEDDAPRERTSPVNRRPLIRNEDVLVASNVPGPSNGEAVAGVLRPELLGHAVSEPGPSQHPPLRQDPVVPLFYPADEDRERSPPMPAVATPPPHSFPEAAPLPLSPPASQSAPAVDPTDEYVASVLEIVPDVQPAHVLGLVEQFIKTHPAQVVELILHALFEDPSYPKIDKKGKRKRTEDEADGAVRGTPKPKIDYANKDREYNCGRHYFELSLGQLMLDFPRIPKPHIRTRLLDNKFYAVSYFALVEDLKQNPLPFKMKLTDSVVSGKGKAKHDPEFDKERQWVLLRNQEIAASNDATLMDEQEYEDTGDGIECGCCFSSYPFDHMIQCPETHLFCKTCMASYASNLLGEHNPNIVCMDQSGCKLAFPESELQRFLSPKLLDLYQRVKQQKEIEAAGLENLEECPFCEYKCVIDNEMEKLFHCENAECAAVTCRACKKPDHLPKSCKEVEEDKHLDAQHVVEEAMTRALMRNCPKCKKAFIKEMGCNKMTCPNCHTVSCYICRKIINGYDHFSNQPPSHKGPRDTLKCLLWDAVEQRSDEEVSAAAKRALEELKRERPDVDGKNIKVDLPKSPKKARAVPAPAPHAPMGADPFGGLNAYHQEIHLRGRVMAAPAYFNDAWRAHANAMEVQARGMQDAERALRELERRRQEIDAMVRGMRIPEPIAPAIPARPPPVPVHAHQLRRRRAR
ncbi:hypothetical protein F5I97DRAFT_1873899 [Phlebopus sp. FC_14]|nr:hypothetical protein F5I97DRAFT_1873899 [Phlebopus sp. FC_14]